MFWGVYRKQEGERTWSDGDDVIVFIVANKTRNPCIEIVLAWSYSIYVKEPFFICSCPKLIILQELNYTYIELYIIYYFNYNYFPLSSFFTYKDGDMWLIYVKC